MIRVSNGGEPDCSFAKSVRRQLTIELSHTHSPASVEWHATIIIDYSNYKSDGEESNLPLKRASAISSQSATFR